jgi:hypothetical protein
MRIDAYRVIGARMAVPGGPGAITTIETARELAPL